MFFHLCRIKAKLMICMIITFSLFCRHIHDKNVRKRDTIKCFNQREITRKRDRQTGLSNVSYKIEQVINMTIIDVPLTILNIALNCDKTITPWCECTKTNENKTP